MQGVLAVDGFQSDVSFAIKTFLCEPVHGDLPLLFDAECQDDWGGRVCEDADAVYGVQ